MGIQLLEILDSKQLELVQHHLRKRVEAKSEKSGLGIVYDITSWCNLRCVGCAVNARVYSTSGCVAPSQMETSTDEVIMVLSKVKDYLHVRPGTRFFLNFGGGEPFIRTDFPEIAKTASSLFGPESIGVDTNGTMVTPEQIEYVAPLVNYLGVSVDGLEEYHNWWRGSSKINDISNSFDRTINTIKSILAMPRARESLEVSTVVTKKNLSQIPGLVRYLHDLGVERYSVHRTMPVGRFSRRPELVPTAEDYLRLLVTIVELNQELGMDVHLHHSIESIYATLLLRHDTYMKGKLGNPDKRSSIGIDPRGNVHFDPWCVVTPWSQLSGGSLLEDGASLESIFGEGILTIAQEYCRPEVRCHGCPQRCSGGSRIASAASFIEQDQSLRIEDVTESHILAGMAEVDPACPLSF